MTTNGPGAVNRSSERVVDGAGSDASVVSRLESGLNLEEGREREGRREGRLGGEINGTAR